LPEVARVDVSGPDVVAFTAVASVVAGEAALDESSLLQVSVPFSEDVAFPTE
jgi:hypothetical protein